MKNRNWILNGTAWGFMHCLAVMTFANPLKVGEQMPDVIIENVINASVDQIRLRDFRDDLIILHFFSIYCGTCVRELSELDQFQMQIKGLKVIPVTNRGEEKVIQMIKKQNWSLPFATAGNETLFQYFPHTMISHVVWIKNMKIVAITEGKYLTKENLILAASGASMQLPVKQDQLGYDRMAPLLINGNGGGGETLKYQSLITGEITGISGGFSRPANGLKSVNTSVIYLYQRIFSEAVGIDFTQSNRVIFETEEDQKKMIRNLDGNHTYCYSLTVPESLTRKEKAQFAVTEINKYFDTFHDFHAVVERRKVKALILIKSDSEFPLRSVPNAKPLFREVENGSVVMVNQPTGSLVHAIQKTANLLHVPVLDGAQVESTFDLTLEPWTNINELKMQLQSIGLEVKLKKVNLEMLVFRKSPGK